MMQLMINFTSLARRQTFSRTICSAFINSLKCNRHKKLVIDCVNVVIMATLNSNIGPLIFGDLHPVNFCRETHLIKSNCWVFAYFIFTILDRLP